MNESYELYIIDNKDRECSVPINSIDVKSMEDLHTIIGEIVNSIFGQWADIVCNRGCGLIPLKAVYVNKFDHSTGEITPIYEYFEYQTTYCDGESMHLMNYVDTSVALPEVKTTLFYFLEPVKPYTPGNKIINTTSSRNFKVQVSRRSDKLREDMINLIITHTTDNGWYSDILNIGLENTGSSITIWSAQPMVDTLIKFAKGVKIR